MKWISAEFKVPEVGRDVLVYAFGAISVRSYFPRNNVDTSGWFPGGASIKGTFWMPLPPPPDAIEDATEGL